MTIARVTPGDVEHLSVHRGRALGRFERRLLKQRPPVPHGICLAVDPGSCDTTSPPRGPASVRVRLCASHQSDGDPCTAVESGMPFDPSALRRPTREIVYAVACEYLPERLRLLGVPQQDISYAVNGIVEIAYRGLDRYDPGDRDPLLALRGWLGAIAVRYVRDLLPSRGRGHLKYEVLFADVEEGAGTQITGETPELCAQREERLRLLAGLLSELRPERREAFILHYAFDLTAPEVANELGVNEEAARSRWRRARLDLCAAVKRLSPDQQDLLRGGALAAVLGALFAKQWSAWWRDSAAQRTAPTRRESTAAGVAGALAAMLVAAFALGPDAATRRTVAPIAHTTHVLPVRDAADVAPSNTTATPATASPVRPRTSKAPTTALLPPRVPTTSRAATRAAADDPLAREMAMLGLVRRSLDQGDHASALSKLEAHAAAFPRSALASWRDQLRAEATAARPSP